MISVEERTEDAKVAEDAEVYNSAFLVLKPVFGRGLVSFYEMGHLLKMDV
ncbi:MAG: hypothetical protein KJ963_07885 [Bacteroidetes bacterium]|nr:hypothetical protein [Bacteroidota bacterium]MBU2636987.1 hypothetical protein [Bacteroidota bacterium]